MISVSRTGQILWGALNRNKICFEKALWHGPVAAHRTVCFLEDFHAGPHTLNSQGGSISITPGLGANQKNVSKFGHWHHQYSVSALCRVGMKVALVKAGLRAISLLLPGLHFGEGVSISGNESINWASRDIFSRTISVFISYFST